MEHESSGWVGQTLCRGRYEVLARLGEGGMAHVYRAWDHKLHSEVVIKAPRRALLEEPQFAVRFDREVRALVQLSHPHIIKVTDVDVHDGLPFAVMQLLTGGSLENLRPRDASGGRLPVPPPELSRWLPDIASALDFIHSKGMIHRDVKPANILFDAHGHALLSDFGVVKVLADCSRDRGTGFTKTGWVIGTPAYMAPELASGHFFDGRADQYALAVTVYELLCGRVPFQGDTPVAILMAHANTPPPEPRLFVSSLPDALARALLVSLNKRPEERFPTCSRLAEAVLSCVPAPQPQPAVAGPPGPVGQGHTGEVHCPVCRGRLNLEASHRSRKVRCSHCGSVLRAREDLSELRFLEGPDNPTDLPTLPHGAKGAGETSPVRPFPVTGGAAESAVPPSPVPEVLDESDEIPLRSESAVRSAVRAPAFMLLATGLLNAVGMVLFIAIGMPLAFQAAGSTTGTEPGTAPLSAAPRHDPIRNLSPGSQEHPFPRLVPVSLQGPDELPLFEELPEVAPSSSDSPAGSAGVPLDPVDTFWLVVAVVSLLAAVPTIVGALEMLRLKSMKMARTAAVLAMIPCLSPLFVLGLPAGLWAWITLDRPGTASWYRSAHHRSAGLGLLQTALWNLILGLAGIEFGLLAGPFDADLHGWAIWGMMASAAAVIVAMGAIALVRTSAHRLAQTGAVFSLLPGISATFPLTLPLGIWALLTLADPDVKDAFDRS